MALEKEIETSYWITANYFRITGLILNTVLNRGSLTLAGYFNQEARQSNSKALMVKEYIIETEDYKKYFSTDLLSTEGENPIKSGYNFIKETDEKFTDAVDV